MASIDRREGGDDITVFVFLRITTTAELCLEAEAADGTE